VGVLERYLDVLRILRWRKSLTTLFGNKVKGLEVKGLKADLQFHNGVKPFKPFPFTFSSSFPFPFKHRIFAAK